MTTALKEPRTGATKGDKAPEPSPYLRRVLDELEQAAVPCEELPKRPTPVAEHTPRPFAYD